MGTLDDERKFQSFAHAAPPVGFEAAWRRAAVTFAQHIQPDMSEANKKELQEGLATTLIQNRRLRAGLALQRIPRLGVRPASTMSRQHR